jgi:hypothetical protein
MVRLEAARLRRWHSDLVDQIAAQEDTAVSVELTGSAHPESCRRLDRVLGVERRLHRVAAGPLEHATLGTRRAVDGSPDLVLDLTSDPATPERRQTLRVAFDEAYGEDAAIEALLARRFPLVTILDSSGTPVARARPGSESPGVLATAYADLLAGCRSLILGVLAGRAFAAPAPCEGEAARARSLHRHAAGQVVSAGLRLGYRTLFRAPHWRVGWRIVDGPGLLGLMDHPDRPWLELPDDGQRFYADPFPFEHDGRTHVFVEDYDHSTGRGVISVVDVGDHGPAGEPRPVLRHDVHLSYPFVLADEGEVWMIPETSAARTIELYRATAYPDRWERAAVLVEGLEASDATVFRWADRWWMAATVRDGGSFSDHLHLWHAERLRGPWTPHRNNPVLIDIASARPAGRVVEQDGRLLRPAQDCRGGYGSAVTVTEIVRLDEDTFEQRLVGRLAPGERWAGHRLHTVNRAGRLECIDGSALSPRFRSRRKRAS